ncbi:MAG: nucleoside-triphosphatase [Ignavibacteriaceae bacterium]|nr:nucleoside-triphosphatase [Ignavibacteriaceae bacterium]
MTDIFIYSGEKGVGKSTYLQDTFLQKPNVCGILQPRINGVKYLVDIVSGEKRRLELDNQADDENVITIGNYIFSQETFLWGKQKLSEAILTTNKLLIIDEIGPLELNGSGLEPVLSEIIFQEITLEKKLLLVVRPKLIEEVTEKYGLLDPVVIHYGEKLPLEIFE